MKNEKGESVHLPTNPLNKFGYNIEFDGSGKFEVIRKNNMATQNSCYS